MAMSVVPAPMSTRHTPSSRSSSVSTDLALATAEGTSSSTERPQRWMHLEMFCTAAAAPVTKCTEASRRTPLMPTGERMPSWPSMRYSCDSLYKTLRSAGIATALADSSTWSRSPGATSRSRIAAVPRELWVSRWLPEIDAHTERMSQPAIWPASSTARWIELTFDSISTTTPFFMPREVWLPTPITSIGSPGTYSPTIAITLEVPMSRPTTRFLSLLRFMGLNVSVNNMGATVFGVRSGSWRRFRPAHREAVAVAQVGVDESVAAAAHQDRQRRDEAREALVGLHVTDVHVAIIRKREAPAAARGEFHAGHAQAVGREIDLRGAIERQHVGHAVIGRIELRQPVDDARVGHLEDAAVAAQQRIVAPVGDRIDLGDGDIERAGPVLAHFHARHPRQRGDRVAHLVEIDREEAGAQRRRHRRAHLRRADVAEGRVYLQLAHRPAIRREPALQHADHRQRDQRDRDDPGGETQGGGAFHAVPPDSRSNEVSSTRQHSSG